MKFRFKKSVNFGGPDGHRVCPLNSRLFCSLALKKRPNERREEERTRGEYERRGAEEMRRVNEMRVKKERLKIFFHLDSSVGQHLRATVCQPWFASLQGYF